MLAYFEYTKFIILLLGVFMYEIEKRDVLKCALKLKTYNLIKLSGGNISTRSYNNSNHIIVTPSGMDYDDINLDDLIVTDLDNKIIEGNRRPSVDTEALIYIYSNIKGVNSIIHTHQVYATAVGLIANKLPVIVTTLANATGGEVTVAPFSSAGTIEMGISTAKYIGDKKAVILKNHGVITIGKDIREALYAAVYLEDAAETYFFAKMIGLPKILNKNQVKEAVNAFNNYGQKV